jgi:flagellin-like protein
MKGISTIIATILLLIITIALAGTAYMFITNFLTMSIAKTINVLDTSCYPFNSTHSNITIIVANEGTANITASDLTVMVDNIRRSVNFDFGTIPPQNTVVATSNNLYASNTKHVVSITSPSNSVRQTMFC